MNRQLSIFNTNLNVKERFELFGVDRWRGIQWKEYTVHRSSMVREWEIAENHPQHNSVMSKATETKGM